jgi:outer membrane protein
MSNGIYTAVAALLIIGALGAHGEDTALTAAKAKSVPLEISLDEACSLALENNPAINSIRERLVQQDGVLKEARALSRPHVAASGNYETFDDARLQSFGDDISVDSTRWNASLDATLTIFSGGRNYQHIKGQEAHKRSIHSSVVATEEDLLLLVHEVYYGAWLADRRVAVQKEAISVLEEQLQMTKNMFDAGSGEKYDVTQAAVALANARPPLIRAGNQRRRSIDRLQEIIGIPYPTGVDASGIKLEPLAEIPSSELTLTDAVATAMSSRPEIERIKHDIESAARELKLMKLAQAPVLDLFAGYGIESDMFGGTSSLEGWSSGIKLNWDILDGGVRRGKVQQARSKARQIGFNSKELELTIKGEVRKAYYDQQEAKAIYEVSAQIIAQAREALVLGQNRYKAGKGTQLEVLESQLQLTRAQLEQSTARRDLELASVQMKRAIGVKIIER